MGQLLAIHLAGTDRGLPSGEASQSAKRRAASCLTYGCFFWIEQDYVVAVQQTRVALDEHSEVGPKLSQVPRSESV
jgi:hypothetical protein